MLFNSYTFWVFFGVVLFLYRVLPHRGQNWMLLVASYVFYGAWDWRFLSLILFSTSVDYLVAIALETPKYRNLRKVVLGVSCNVNLGLLGFFKYFNFFAQELTDVLAELGLRFMPLRCRSTVIFQVTRRSPAVWRVGWAFTCPRTSSFPISRSPRASSGAAGTSASLRGCATICIFRWAATAPERGRRAVI